MHNKSVLTGGGRPKGERALLNLYSAVQCAAGLLLLAVPGGMLRDAFVPAACWLLLFSMLLTLARMILFSRGFADFAMCLVVSLEYGFFSWCFSSLDLTFVEGYRPVVSFALLFVGISRILAFAQIMDRARLPLLVVAGLIEGTSAVLLLLGLPDDSTFYLYLFPGVLCILAGAMSFSEALRVHASHRLLPQRYR